MSRFLSDREMLLGDAVSSQKLIPIDFPIQLSAKLYKGAWVITEGGELQWSNGEEWIPLAPPGTEMMIPPWVDVPEGWFEISGKLGGDFTNRRVIANKFDFAYVDNDLLSWMLPVSANMWETSDQNVQVASPPSPVGFLIDSVLPRVNWVQSVSGNRPVWERVTRFAAGADRTIDRITFNRLGQAFVLGIPARTIGTMIVCTSQGIYALGVDIPQGNYTYGRWDHLPVEEVLLLSKFLTNSEIEAFKDFLVETRFRVRDNFGAMTSMADAFRNRTDITSLPQFNLSAVTTAKGMCEGMTNLQTLPLYNMPLCQSYENFLVNCSSLTSLPPLKMDYLPMSVNGARSAFRGLSSLETFNPNIKIPISNNWQSMFSGLTICDNRQGNDFVWSFPPQNSANVVNFSSTWSGQRNAKNFAPHDFSNANNIYNAWQDNWLLDNRLNRGPGISVTPDYSFPMCNFENVVNASRAWLECRSMTHFPPVSFPSVIGTPLVNWNTAGFGRTWTGCILLAHFPPNVFDGSNCSNYTDAFLNCALTETSVDNILVSVNTARATFGLTDGRVDITGGTNASPSVATGRPAVDALRAAGWIVNVVGYPA